jgi:hypothetical protein
MTVPGDEKVTIGGDEIAGTDQGVKGDASAVPSSDPAGDTAVIVIDARDSSRIVGEEHPTADHVEPVSEDSAAEMSVTEPDHRDETPERSISDAIAEETSMMPDGSAAMDSASTDGPCVPNCIDALQQHKCNTGDQCGGICTCPNSLCLGNFICAL